MKVKRRDKEGNMGREAENGELGEDQRKGRIMGS